MAEIFTPFNLNSRSFDKKRPVGKVPIVLPTPPKTSMSSSRKKMLEDLREREIKKQKRERMGNVLIAKILSKYGRYCTKTTIERVVNDFLMENDAITAVKLQNLEKHFQELTQSKEKKPEPQPMSETPETIAREEGRPYQIAEASGKPFPPNSKKGAEWKIISAYQGVLNEEQEKQGKEQVRIKRHKFKEALDMQVNAAKANIAIDESEKRVYAERVNKDLQDFHELEARKREAAKLKNAEEMILRKKQIEEKIKHREAEESRARLVDAEAVQNAKDNLLREKQKQNQIKMREREMHTIMEKYNIENKKRREDQKIVEIAEDNRLMQEYAAKLDREARDRETAFQKRLEVMAKFASKYEEDGAGKAEKEKERKVEILLLQAQQQKEELDRQKELQKDADRRDRLRAALTENERILQFQERIEILHKHEEGEYGLKCLRDAEKHKQEEAAERRKKKEKQMEYRGALGSQCKEREGVDTNLVGMAEQELRLNQRTLRLAVEDPETREKILKRLPDVGIGAVERVGAAIGAAINLSPKPTNMQLKS